ncbi:unnamed protein product, partial [Phaeothamnion confervicola]
AAPVLVFVHGGYWQEGSAADSLFLAPEVHRHGWSYAAVEYSLAPAARVAAMVDEVRAAVDQLAAASSSIVLVGHSAGAQLAAMTAVTRAVPAVRRVVLVSGVYELEPLTHTSINDPLQFTDEDLAALSPMRLDAPTNAELVVVWGEIEPSAFGRQGRAYADRLRQFGHDVTSFEVAGRNHFDILFDLADPSTRLGAVTLAALR